MYALLFDIYGKGERWEVDTIGTLETCIEEKRVGLRQGLPHRCFAIVEAQDLKLNEIVKEPGKRVG